VALLYRERFGEPLNVQQYGCLNMNQFFNSMKHMFYFHQVGETTYVNCYLPIGSVKLIAEPHKTRLDLNSLENISFIFEPHDFNCIRSILIKSMESAKSLKVSQFEQDFISQAGFAFNYLKYGFKSTSDFFITFSQLFELKDPSIDSDKLSKNYSVKNSLGDMLIIMKVPYL